MPLARIARVKKAPSLVEQVCYQLAAFARDGNGAAQGELMAERSLAEQLGVSRNVLREAIKRLELQGLVEIRQGRGTRIVNKLHKPLTAALHLLVPQETERMQQLFEVRLILEPQCARLAAHRASLEQLRQMEDAQLRLSDAGSIESAVEADMDFHRAIAEASANRILLLVLESLAELLAASQNKGFRAMGHSCPVQMHQAVLDAIVRRDGDAAAAAMTAHITDAQSTIDRSETTALQ